MSSFAQIEAGHVNLGASSSKIWALTGIRGIAAVWVVLFHLSAVAAVGNINRFSGIPIVRSGHLAVDMFFILSGFVLALTYGSALQRPTWTSLRDFWIGRAFRILPLHWTALFFCLALYIVLGKDLVMTQRHDATSFIYSMLLVQNWLFMPKVWNLPAWSLSAEWLAYILFPIAVILTNFIKNNLQAIATITAMWGVLFFACFLSGDITLDHIRSLGLIRCLIEFPIGIILYRIWFLNRLISNYGNTLFLCGVAILTMAITSPVFDLLAVPAFALIVLAAGSGSSFTKALMGNRVVIALGEISFSAYILHWLIVEMAAYVIVTKGVTGNGATWVLGLAFVSVWPIAWLSWRLIELPSQKYSKVLLRYVRAKNVTYTRAVDIIEKTDLRHILLWQRSSINR